MSKTKTVPTIAVGANAEAVKKVKEAILEILECTTAENATKQIALQVLQKACSVDGTMITNCHFQG